MGESKDRNWIDVVGTSQQPLDLEGARDNIISKLKAISPTSEQIDEELVGMLTRATVKDGDFSGDGVYLTENQRVLVVQNLGDMIDLPVTTELGVLLAMKSLCEIASRGNETPDFVATARQQVLAHTIRSQIS